MLKFSPLVDTTPAASCSHCCDLIAGQSSVDTPPELSRNFLGFVEDGDVGTPAVPDEEVLVVEEERTDLEELRVQFDERLGVMSVVEKFVLVRSAERLVAGGIGTEVTAGEA